MPLISLGEFEKLYPDAKLNLQPPEEDKTSGSPAAQTPDEARMPYHAPESQPKNTNLADRPEEAEPSITVDGMPMQSDSPWVAKNRRKKLSLAGLGAGVLALGMLVGPNIGGEHSDVTGPTAVAPIDQPTKAKPKSNRKTSPSAEATSEPSQAPLTNAESITKPAAWSDCTKPIVNLSIGANASVYVPVKLRTGQIAPVKFQPPTQDGEKPDPRQPALYPQATYYGSMAVAACVNNQSTTSLFTVNGKTVTVNRDNFITHALFPAVNQPGSISKETVQGMDPKHMLVPDKQINANQVEKVKNWMLPTGANHDAYGKSVDWLLRGEILSQTTQKEGATISALIDKYFKAQLDAANKGEGYQFSFFGSYASLSDAYNIETALFKPIRKIRLVEKPAVAPTIIKTESQAA